MVICLERGADLHTAQLMPMTLTISCFSEIRIGLASLVPAHLGGPRQRAVKRMCVCVCVCVQHQEISISSSSSSSSSSSGFAAVGLCRDRQTNGQTGQADRQMEGRTPYRYIDPVPHTMWAVPKTQVDNKYFGLPYSRYRTNIYAPVGQLILRFCTAALDHPDTSWLCQTTDTALVHRVVCPPFLPQLSSVKNHTAWRHRVSK